MPPTGRWIALCLHDLSNKYQRMLWDDAKKASPRYDHSISALSADKNPDIQVVQIRSILDLPDSRRPTAIIVSAVRENMLLAVAKEAVSKGIAWDYLCRWTDSIHELRRSNPRVPVFSVSPNQHNVGRTQGMQLDLLLRPGDELVYIQGPTGTSTAQRRLVAAQQTLSHLPNLKCSIFNSDWSAEGGCDVMQGWLKIFSRGSLPGFVLAAQNDDMAMGARRAVLARVAVTPSLDSEYLRFLGCDGNPGFGQRLVSEGELTATVTVPAVSGRAVDEIFSALSSGRPSPAEINVDVGSYPTLEDLARKYPRIAPEKRETQGFTQSRPRR